MSSILKKLFWLFCFSSVLFNCLLIASSQDNKKMQMIQDLEVIKHHFEVGYAPSEWKKEYVGWDLEEAFERSKNRVLELPSITTKQFQIIVRDFLNSMKDYHVDVVFFSTEAAVLPFRVKGAQGRYFIDWIDPLRLPSSHYAVHVGDEIVEFGEQPIDEVIEELKKEHAKSTNAATDQSFAEQNLTIRSGAAGDHVPQGPIVIKTLSANTGKVNQCQIHWSYTPEQVKSPWDFLPSFLFSSSLSSSAESKTNFQFPLLKMANPLHEVLAEKHAEREGDLGAQKSFIPLLGELIWSIDADSEAHYWNAYIYRHSQGYNVGYIRIPHYVGFAKHVEEFGKILNYLQENTDALVIDQVHNFGGLVNFQYQLLAMLAQKPLKTPYHRVKITQKQILEAYNTLEAIKTMEIILQNVSTSEDSPQKNKREDQQSFDFNYQQLMFLKTYYEFVLEEWSQGHTLTQPTPILGIDRINPHPKYQYTKPIVMLINEMDFSGGDFMPAILQDNQRAVLFGNRTAGAGGYVFSFEFPNKHGIAQCSYTASIAERTNMQKIENLGVTPDVEYQITAEDLQNHYQGYVEAVNQTIQQLIEK